MQVAAVVRQIVDEGRRAAGGHPSFAKFGMMFSWHDAYYLGGDLPHIVCLPCRPHFYAPSPPKVPREVGGQSKFSTYHTLTFKGNVGAGAHGLCGILHTLLLACDYYDPADLYTGSVPLLALIEQATLALVDEAFPSSNLPSSLGKEADR